MNSPLVVVRHRVAAARRTGRERLTVHAHRIGIAAVGMEVPQRGRPAQVHVEGGLFPDRHRLTPAVRDAHTVMDGSGT